MRQQSWCCQYWPAHYCCALSESFVRFCLSSWIFSFEFFSRFLSNGERSSEKLPSNSIDLVRPPYHLSQKTVNHLINPLASNDDSIKPFIPIGILHEVLKMDTAHSEDCLVMSVGRHKSKTSGMVRGLREMPIIILRTAGARPLMRSPFPDFQPNNYTHWLPLPLFP